MHDNRALSRFELTEQGLTAYADYRRGPRELVIAPVYAPPALRGTGTAGRLMRAVAEQARADGVRIVPLCGYARAWLHRSPAHRDLIA